MNHSSPRSRSVRLAALALLLGCACLDAAAQFGEAQHVTISVEDPARVAAGSSFDLPVTLKISSGFHIQSNKPAANYVPTVVAVTGPAGFEFGEAKFPPAEMTRAAGETIPVFSNSITVRVPVKVPTGFAGEARLTVKVSYQACDAGSCFPPTETSKEVRVIVGDGGAASASKPSPAQQAPPAASGSTTKKPQGNAQQDTHPRTASPPPRPTAVATTTRPVPEQHSSTSEAPFRGYAMAKVTEFVGPEQFVRFLEGGTATSSAGAGRVAQLLQGGNLILALPLIFLLGLALNLTPCVYPIIPITISYFGSQTAVTGRKPLVLAAVYVLGMAAMYSALGVAAGLTGTLFGSQLQSPWVLLVFALIMFGLALSQFDRPDGRPIWEFQLPGFLRNRAQTRSGILGALLMGMMVGVVAAPCIGPAVIALLQWVGMQQSPVLGFAVFFSLALGLGLPYLFLAAASGSVQSLPRSGEWMMGVKHVFGAVLIWMGFYYLQTPLAMLHPAAPKVAMVVVTLAIGLYLLLFERSGLNVRWFRMLRRLIAIGAFILAVWLALPAPREQIRWQAYSDSALEAALSQRKPVLIDFTAAWCAACRELEHKTFSDPRVGAASRGYVALRADMTNFRGAAARRWQKTYGIKGLPTVVRLTPN